MPTASWPDGGEAPKQCGYARTGNDGRARGLIEPPRQAVGRRAQQRDKGAATQDAPVVTSAATGRRRRPSFPAPGQRGCDPLREGGRAREHGQRGAQVGDQAAGATASRRDRASGRPRPRARTRALRRDQRELELRRQGLAADGSRSSASSLRPSAGSLVRLMRAIAQAATVTTRTPHNSHRTGSRDARRPHDGGGERQARTGHSVFLQLSRGQPEGPRERRRPAWPTTVMAGARRPPSAPPGGSRVAAQPAGPGKRQTSQSQDHRGPGEELPS